MTEVTRAPISVTFHDDPRVVDEQRAEDYARHVVPTSTRIPRLRLMMSSWSMISALVWLFYGALVASLVGTQQAVIGIVLTVLAYTALNWYMVTWGARFGLNSLLLSRRMFGAVGATLTAVLIAANATYYAVFESSVLAVGFQQKVGGPSLEVWYLIVVVALLPLMFGNVQGWLDKVNAVLLPVYVVGVAAAVVVAAQRGGAPGWWDFPGVIPAEARAVPGWLMTFVLYMGIWLIMPVVIEFGRQARPEDLGFHRNVTFGAGFFTWLFLLNGLAGVYLVSAVLPNQPAAEAGVVQALLSTLGVGGLLLIIATQTRINTLNYYLASMGWARFFGSVGLRLHRVVWVVLTAAIAYVLMLTDVFSWLTQALTWQGVFFVSWVGIIVTHFALVPEDRRNGPEFRPGRLQAVTPGLAVWVLASVIGIWVAEHPAGFPTLSQVAPLLALAISVVLYGLALKLGPSSLRPRSSDLRTQIGDLSNARVACHGCERSYVAIEMDNDPSADGAPLCNACAETSRPFRKAVRADG